MVSGKSENQKSSNLEMKRYRNASIESKRVSLKIWQFSYFSPK